MYLIKKFILIILFSFVLFFLFLYISSPILNATSLIFPYAIHPFDIVNQYPLCWNIIKKMYCVNLFISIFIIVNSVLSFFINIKEKEIPVKKPASNNISEKGLYLYVGNNFLTKEKIFIPEKGLFQNILVTGTIGSRQN